MKAPSDGGEPAASPGAPKARRLVDLAVAFGRVGLFGFGGGPAFLPLIQREVERRGWLSREAYIDALAFGNALPGPITTKLAGYVGYTVAGAAGATVALLALCVPTIVMMIALASLYTLYGDAPAVTAFLTGLRPVVIALLLVVVITFVPTALVHTDRRVARTVLCAIAFALAVGAGIHPALLIVAGGLIGTTLLRSA
ncbi:MAG: chromate transporter [Trueperaceae bacterium]|nr:chromate transporter [Trueperaceae bacterium]